MLRSAPSLLRQRARTFRLLIVPWCRDRSLAELQWSMKLKVIKPHWVVRTIADWCGCLLTQQLLVANFCALGQIAKVFFKCGDGPFQFFSPFVGVFEVVGGLLELLCHLRLLQNKGVILFGQLREVCLQLVNILLRNRPCRCKRHKM